MKEYFIVENNEKQGPFSIEDLKERSITPETLVWEESFDDWKQAKEIPEISSIVISKTSMKETLESDKIKIPDIIEVENTNENIGIDKMTNPITNNKKFSGVFYYLVIFPVVYVVVFRILDKILSYLNFFSTLGNLQTAIFIFIGFIIFWIIIKYQPTKKMYLPLIAVVISYLLTRSVSYFIMSINDKYYSFDFFEFILLPLENAIFYVITLLDFIAAFLINFFYHRAGKSLE